MIGIFPTRDMTLPSSLRRSGDVAEDFAADAHLARLAVGHHALGVVTMATPRPFITFGIS